MNKDLKLVAIPTFEMQNDGTASGLSAIFVPPQMPDLWSHFAHDP